MAPDKSVTNPLNVPFSDTGNVYGQPKTFGSPISPDFKGIDLGGEATTGTGFFPAKIEWNATSSAYDWGEQMWDNTPAGTDAWIDKTTGRSTAGYSGFTGSYSLAKEQSDLEDLPDGLVVWIWTVKDDTGATQYLFNIPINGQSGTPTVLSSAGTSNSWSIAGGETSIGCTFTPYVRLAFVAGSAGTPGVLNAYTRTIQLDPTGAALSISAESSPVAVLTATELTVVTDIYIDSNTLKFSTALVNVIDSISTGVDSVTSSTCP